MIVFDIDGTLSIVGDRAKHLKRRPPDWGSFRARCSEDLPNNGICYLYKSLWHMENVMVVTSRPESCREATVVWFARYGLQLDEVDLLMRADGDKRQDVIVKPELIEPYKDDITCIFEDRIVMAREWRRLGYTCCDVAGN